MSFLFRNTALAGLALTALLGAGCEQPPVVPTADRRQNTHTSRIDGNVLVQGRVRGNAVVLLYDADRPPPPLGSGRPVTFTVIPREQLFGAAGADESGPFLAPFTFSLVAEGRYTVRGFIDADTCGGGAQPCHKADFIPWYDVTGQPNAGDVGGAAVELGTTPPRPRVLEVAPREDGALNAVTGVTVSFSAEPAYTVPLDRPVFRVEGGGRMDPAAGTKVLTLKPEPIQDGVMDVRPPGFLVRYVDENGDGAPDLDSAGKPALWPRVVVRKLAEAPSLADENDLDRNGVLDAQGRDYVHQDNSQDGQPDLVVLRAGLVTDALYAALDKDGAPSMAPIIVPELTLAVLPQAVDARDPRAPALLKTVPSGRYSVTLVQPTGQTWRVPNELTPALAKPLGLPEVESQAFFLEVP